MNPRDTLAGLHWPRSLRYRALGTVQPAPVRSTQTIQSVLSQFRFSLRIDTALDLSPIFTIALWLHRFYPIYKMESKFHGLITPLNFWVGVMEPEPGVLCQTSRFSPDNPYFCPNYRCPAGQSLYHILVTFKELMIQAQSGLGNQVRMLTRL